MSRLSLFIFFMVLISEQYRLQLSSSSLIFTPILITSPSFSVSAFEASCEAVASPRFMTFRAQSLPIQRFPILAASSLSPLDRPLSMNTPFHRSCYITRSFDRLHRCPSNLSLKSFIRSTRLLLDIVIVFIYVHPWCVLLRCRAVAEVGGRGR